MSKPRIVKVKMPLITQAEKETVAEIQSLKDSGAWNESENERELEDQKSLIDQTTPE